MHQMTLSPAASRTAHSSGRLCALSLSTGALRRARRATTPCSIARSARCGSPLEAADFVVPRRRKACPLALPHYGGGRSGRLDFGSFATIKSYDVSIRSRISSEGIVPSRAKVFQPCLPIYAILVAAP
jgi:hypothetical protein